MTEQSAPASEKTPEEKAEIERHGKIIAWIIGLTLAAVVAFIAIRNPHHEATAEELKGDAQRACQEEFIPARLKAPATAQFSGVTVAEVGGSYRVTGSVDSQNGFGALVRSGFTCSVRSEGDQWVLESAAVQTP